MYPISEQFGKAALAINRELVIKARLKTADKSWELTKKDIEAGGLSITESIMGDQFQLGSVTAKSITLKLNNRDGRWNNEVLNGATLTPYCGFVLADGTEEYVPMGVFIIDEPSRPYATMTLKGMDRLILLDEPLSVLNYRGQSAQQLIQLISNYCHVPLSAHILELGDQKITMPIREGADKMSCRDAMSELAILYGGYVRMTRTGELEIVPFRPLTKKEAIVMPLGSRKNFTVTSDPITITGMKYKEKIWGTDDYLLEIPDLNLLGDDQVDQLTGMWSQLNGFTYTAYTADYFGNPALDAGDTVLHQTRDGEVLSFISKHSYVHGGSCKLEADGKSRVTTGYKSANERRLTKIAAKAADNLTHELSSYQEATAHISDLIGMMLGVYKTTEEFPDGSVKLYYHDKPQLENSENIWAFNGKALAFSDDGGKTWGAITSNQSLVIKMIEAIGINAKWIIAGRIEGKSSFWNLDTGLFETRAGSNRVRIYNGEVISFHDLNPMCKMNGNGIFFYDNSKKGQLAGSVTMATWISSSMRSLNLSHDSNTSLTISYINNQSETAASNPYILFDHYHIRKEFDSFNDITVLRPIAFMDKVRIVGLTLDLYILDTITNNLGLSNPNNYFIEEFNKRMKRFVDIRIQQAFALPIQTGLLWIGYDSDGDILIQNSKKGGGISLGNYANAVDHGEWHRL